MFYKQMMVATAGLLAAAGLGLLARPPWARSVPEGLQRAAATTAAAATVVSVPPGPDFGELSLPAGASPAALDIQRRGQLRALENGGVRQQLAQGKAGPLPAFLQVADLPLENPSPKIVFSSEK